MKIVVIAGGEGTRLRKIAGNLPKAMVPFKGKPILEYQLELAKRYGFSDFIFLTGYLGEYIEKYFASGDKWGINIEYVQEKRPLGTAGAIKQLDGKIHGDFFVFYADTILSVALDKMLAFHKEKQGEGTLLVHPNDHPFDSDLLELGKNKEVVKFFPKPHDKGPYRNLVNAALYILSEKIFSYIKPGKFADLGRDIFPKMVDNSCLLFGYETAEFIKDVGTPERYYKVLGDLESGKVERLNKSNKQKAIFLDRDGVINKEVDLLDNEADFMLLPGVSEAIKKINDSEYLAVVVTNQPVIARNLLSVEGLETIHKIMETTLGNQGAYLDAIYYCPHHPDGGYPEENEAFKIKCECRKPNPGMLIEASKALNVDLSKSYIIGDSERDIMAGNNGGVQTILVNRNGGKEHYCEIRASYRCVNLLEAVNIILEESK